jgi:hypothetical protein
MTTGLIPVYRGSSRLIGIELIDVGNVQLPAGWKRQVGDSGVEVVLDPPEIYEEAIPKIQALDAVLDNTNTCGVHVHVQAADYSVKDCVRLANLYRHFQPVINCLSNNHSCATYDKKVTRRTLVEKFRITTPASTRSEARIASRSVINFAMMRCTKLADRTVEFCQGSADCIAGWVAFTLALTDLARNQDACTDVLTYPATYPATLEGLKRAMVVVEQFRNYLVPNAQHLDEWVQWRYDVMAKKID